MLFRRIVAPLLLALLLLTSFAAGTAHAADEPPVDAAVMDHQLACENGVCSLRIDLGAETPTWLPATGMVLSVLENNLNVLPERAGISVSDGLVLDLPIGNLKLADANIDVTLGDDGSVESFLGTAQLPTRSLGLLGRAGSKNPIATTVGFDYASALPAVNASLDPDRKYLYFDLGRGTELEATVGDGAEVSLWLSIPEGQRATIVVDPLERFAYIDGNLTMRYSGSVAFLAGMVDGFEAADLLSGDLPLRHEATVHVSGVVTDKLADSRLELEGRYAVDGGKLAEWFNVNGEPLALEGGLVISDAGMLGTGVVRSTLMPENVWNSAVQGQVFIPFSTDFRQAYAALNTRRGFAVCRPLRGRVSAGGRGAGYGGQRQPGCAVAEPCHGLGRIFGCSRICWCGRIC